MGREPFERVGACQTLARQTAPTALAPVYHLTAWSPSRFEDDSRERLERLEPATGQGISRAFGRDLHGHGYRQKRKAGV
jgi:hypothetical protein